MPNKRNNATDLLKLIAIVMILVHHYVIHGGFDALNFSTCSFPLISMQMLAQLGRMACLIFTLITGYYMIGREKIPVARRVISLIGEMLFYSVGLCLLVKFSGADDVDGTAVFRSFFPMIWGYWFIKYYVLFLLFVPFISKMLDRLDHIMYRRLVVLFFTVWSLLQTLNGNQWDFGRFSVYIAGFLFGGYIRKFYRFQYPNKRNLLLGIGFGLMNMLSVPLICLLGFVLNREWILNYAFYFRDYNSVLSVLCSVFLFIYFVNVEISIPLLGKISTTTAGIYLIHENNQLRNVLWRKISPNALHFASPFGHMAIKVVCILTACIVIDLVRQKTVGRWFDRLTEGIVSKIDNGALNRRFSGRR